MADLYSSRKSRFKWTNNDVLQKKSPLTSSNQKVSHQGCSRSSIKSSQMRSNVWRPGVAYQGAVSPVAKEKGHTSASYSRQHKRAHVGRFHSNKVWVPGSTVSLKETHRLAVKIESRDHPSKPGCSEPSRSTDVHPTVQSSVTKLDSVPVSGVDSRSSIDIKNRSTNNFKRSLHCNRVWKPQNPFQSNVQEQVPASPLKPGAQPKEVCAQSEIQRKHQNLVWRPERVAVTKQPEVTGGTTSKGNQPRSSFIAKSTSKSSRYRWRRTFSHSKSAESLKSPTCPKTSTQSPYHSLWLKKRKQGMRTTHRRSVAHLKWTRVGGSVKATTPREPLKPHSVRRRRSSFGDKYQNSPEGSVFFRASQSRSSRSTRFRWVSSLSLKRTHPAGVSPLHRSSGKVLASRQIPKLHRRMQRQNRNRVWISARSRVFRRMDQSPHGQMKPALSSNRLPPTLSVLAYSSTIHSPSANRVLASRAIQRSKAYFWSIKQKQLCTYYCRFGKCSRDNCPYVHDKDKIAICPQFLLGVCEKTDGSCLLSHKNDRNKMPVCLFYLRGVCGREDCPYLHVNLGKEAEVCKEFIKGHCVHGEECTKLHAYYCPEYTIYGECARGTGCPLKHRKQARLTLSRSKKSKQAHLTNAKTPKAFKKNKAIEAACDDGGNGDGEQRIGSESSVVALRPLDLDEMPDFIPL